MPHRPHILVIDDERDICDAVRRWLGFLARVSTVTEALKGVDLITNGDFDAILIDHSMPELSGLELMKQLTSRGKPLPPVMMMTGHGSLDLAMQFIRAGGSDFLEKPLNLELLSSRLLHLAESHIQKRRILELEKERDILMAALSHDIRSPLGVIINVIELLRDPKENKEQHMLDLLFESSRYLHALTDDFLIIAKDKSKTLPNKPVTLDIRPVLTAVKNQLEVASRIRKIALHLTLPAEAIQVDIDLTRFRQVITNLCDNALKHSRCKNLEILVKVDAGTVVFVVRDDGKGLPEEIAANLIAAFKRSSSDSGFGLGLAICARLCQSIGSELHYTRLDKGGEFSFRLPLIPPA